MEQENQTHVADVGPVTGVSSENAVEEVVVRTALRREERERREERGERTEERGQRK